MHLRRLDIRSLPGIEPGFVFEPPGPGVNIVTGPNAIGKSSLARALGFLLAAERSDPRALSLEAEFQSGEVRWQVQRNGSQITWRRNGEAATRPALPSADQIGHYRLSIETLLDDDDASDEALAERLRRELHGNFDLASLERGIGPRFARQEAKSLDDARGRRRAVESTYAALRHREAELPDLERRIDAAREARKRCESLERALKLADAVDARKRWEAELAHFPSDMALLRGDELERLERAENQARVLRDEVRERHRIRTEAEAALQRTGLARARPASEEMQALAAKLRALGELRSDRRNARMLSAQSEAELRDALAPFNDAGTPPRLDRGSLRQVEEIALPLIAARTRIRELRERLSLAGKAPEESEIEGLREGVEALRAWLAATAGVAARARGSTRWTGIAVWVALAAAALAALAAVLEGAVFALVGAAAALLASVFALFMQRAARAGASSPGEEAERRFRESGIEAPGRWDEESVRRHLRESVEVRLNELILQRQRAADVDRIVLQVAEAEQESAALEERRASLAEEIGFDPGRPVFEFDRFVRQCSAWDEARRRHAKQCAALARLDGDLIAAARELRDLLSPWRAADAPGLDGEAEPPDVDLVHSAFDALQQRIEAAGAAQSEIRSCETALQSLRRQMTEAEAETKRLFVQAGLEAGAALELRRRLDRLEQWRETNEACGRAKTEEDLVRAGLSEHRDLLELVDEGRRAELEGTLDGLSGKADEHRALIELRTGVLTRLEDAGANLELERAAAAESRAEETLADKREDALLSVATETLVQDVEQAFVAEHEPAVLRRARDIFAQVTARAFALGLQTDGAFVARDVRQGVTRALGELSSGTRAQLLLALRLAWTEAQEEGGEALPLFLDEALTTSDEDRFAVMARSLERIATAEGRPRQVFYLSARRHESALWKGATGTEPATLDLASIRFRGQAAAPDDHRVEESPSLPAPEGHRPESYARLLEVPRLDPRRPEGSVHLFHLLRDDLPLLHSLMDTWRIQSLGQLEALLASDAAPAALAGEESCDRLRARCRALRIWVELWRQGRGRPVDRGVLEQCGAVSAVFIDRAAELAKRVEGDGEAFLQALRDGELGHFRLSKMEELERELIDVGCIDPRPRLDGEERRRLNLQRSASQSRVDAGDINRVVGWLESAAGGAEPHPPAESNSASWAGVS